MPRPIITLTTDFGTSSHYVAQMKGVILGLCPEANIVDITHAIAAQDIQAGAIALRDAVPYFPTGTIHVAVVDPGVGSNRQILALKTVHGHFIGPDNGLLSLAASHDTPEQIIALRYAGATGQAISNTFHGRDVMAPAAARIALGVDPATLGDKIGQFVRLELPPVKRTQSSVAGCVTHIDSFGNAISNITADDLAALAAPGQALSFRVANTEIGPLVCHYAERPAGSCVALIGSSGHLEVAQVNGSAAAELRIRVGDPVVVQTS